MPKSGTLWRIAQNVDGQDPQERTTPPIGCPSRRRVVMPESQATTTMVAKYQNILFDTDGQIAIVTLNRPQRRNALSLELMKELIDCLNEIGSDRTLRVVLLRAAGKAFSSGHDLSEMVGRDINEYRQVFDVCTELMTCVQSIPQPVIAEAQGIATAAGCQLVATCDLAVASDQAAFSTPGVYARREDWTLLHNTYGGSQPSRWA